MKNKDHLRKSWRLYKDYLGVKDSGAQGIVKSIGEIALESQTP